MHKWGDRFCVQLHSMSPSIPQCVFQVIYKSETMNQSTKGWICDIRGAALWLCRVSHTSSEPDQNVLFLRAFECPNLPDWEMAKQSTASLKTDSWRNNDCSLTTSHRRWKASSNVKEFCVRVYTAGWRRKVENNFMKLRGSSFIRIKRCAKLSCFRNIPYLCQANRGNSVKDWLTVIGPLQRGGLGSACVCY